MLYHTIVASCESELVKYVPVQTSRLYWQNNQKSTSITWDCSKCGKQSSWPQLVQHFPECYDLSTGYAVQE